MTSEWNLLVGMACRTVLEKALSRYLTLGANSGKLLRQLAGKTVTLNLTSPGTTIVFCFTPEGVQLLQDSDGTSDLSISGSPWRLLEALAAPEPSKGGLEASLDVQGDMETARTIQTLLAGSCVLEAARMVQDLARKRSIQGLFRWFVEVRETLRKDVSEFLQEEIRIVPARNEAEAQFSAITELDDAVARLDARIKQMEHSLGKAT